MKILAELRDEDVGWKVKKADTSKRRLAARAILLKDNKIALLNVTKYGYHKLPGGGVESKEGIEQALFREVLEETGCTIRINGIIGKIIEYRTQENTIQTSFCYLAEVVEKGKPKFDRGELEAGLKLEWVSVNNAIKLLEKERPKTYDGKFIVRRDSIFIKAAKIRKSR